jgi:hypothetical protein
MPILPLQLARYIIGLSEKDPLALETSEASSENDSTDDTGTLTPVVAEAETRRAPNEVVYRDSHTIVKVAETFIGLWLAVIWLTIGRLVGPGRNR